MDNSIVVAIIGIIGGVLTAILSSYLASKFTAENSKKTIESQLEQQTNELTHSSEEQRKQLVADDISKSRIEWLNRTRKIVSDYMSNTIEYRNKVNEMNCLNPKPESESFLKYKVLTSELYQKSQSSYYEAYYSFNDKESISTFLVGFNYIAKVDDIGDYQRVKLEKLISKVFQSYFKKEWHKAKEEIKTGEVSTEDDYFKNNSFLEMINLFDRYSIENKNRKKGFGSIIRDIIGLEHQCIDNKDYASDLNKYKNKIQNNGVFFLSKESYETIDEFASEYDKTSDEYKLISITCDIYDFPK